MSAPTADHLRARVAGVLEIPLHRFLGVRLLDEQDAAAGVVFAADEPALNNVGVVHGGVVTALLDVACYLALLPQLGDDEHAVSHDVAVSLVRAVPAGAQVEVSGTIVRRGRAVAFLRAEARVDGEVVAAGQVTKTVLRPR